jgi:hypothetical protein
VHQARHLGLGYRRRQIGGRCQAGRLRGVHPRADQQDRAAAHWPIHIGTTRIAATGKHQQRKRHEGQATELGNLPALSKNPRRMVDALILGLPVLSKRRGA